MSKENGQLSCSEHRDSVYSFLNVSKNIGGKRLLCGECLYSQENLQWKQDFNDIMPLSIVYITILIISQVLRNPEYLFEKIKNDSDSKFAKLFFQKCVLDLEKEFNKQIEKFSLLEQIYAQIKDQIKIQLKEFQDFQQQMKKIGQDFLESIQFNQFAQLIASLKDMDKQFKSDQYISINQKISGIVDDLMKDSCQIISSKIKELDKNYKNLNIKLTKLSCEKFQQQILELFKQHDEFLSNQQKNIDFNFKFERPKSNLLTGYFLDQLNTKFTSFGKQIKQMNLLFLGSRDGLSTNSFWTKVNNKSQLLMVCKTKTNDFIYGGYYPGQWMQNNNSWQTDASLTSFLFSQNHNEIYPLKSGYQNSAIHFNGYIVYFGSGAELLISNDFASLSSNLGSSYSIEQYKITQNHLFGGAQGSVGECEVYEMIFQ